MNAEFAKTLRRRLYPLYESLIQSVKGFSYSKAFSVCNGDVTFQRVNMPAFCL